MGYNEVVSERREDDLPAKGDVAVLTRPKVARPKLYRVIMLNDDYTTMDFVVHVLQKFFHKTYEEAHKIMLHVHYRGKGICGLYPYDIAATKVAVVIDYARKHDMPLKCVLEEE